MSNRPSLFPPPAIVDVLTRAAEIESKLRGSPVTWQDIARALLAQTLGIHDTMPGGLDVGRLRGKLGLAPVTFGGVDASKGKRGKRAST